MHSRGENRERFEISANTRISLRHNVTPGSGDVVDIDKILPVGLALVPS